MYSIQKKKKKKKNASEYYFTQINNQLDANSTWTTRL